MLESQHILFPGKGVARLVSEAVDESPEPGKIVVRNDVSLVSPGTELAMFCGTHRMLNNPAFPWASYPFKPGYSSVGRVVVPDGAFSRNVRVAHQSPHGPVSRTNSGMAAIVPDGLDSDRAAFFRLVQIAMTAPRLAPARDGIVVVIGLGMIGNLAAQVYRELGARVVAVDRIAKRIAIARECGIEALDSGDGDLASTLKAAGLPAPELIVDAVASPATVGPALKAVATLGRVVVLGSPRVDMELDVYFDIHVKGASLIGAHECLPSRATRDADAPMLMDWLLGNRVRVLPIVTHRVSLADMPEMYCALRDRPGDVLGVLVEYPKPTHS